jgi:hypothetical protein
MAQGQDLEVQRDSGAHQPAERQEQPNQHGWHREESLSVTAGKFNGANEYGLYSRHRVGGSAGLTSRIIRSFQAFKSSAVMHSNVKR